MIEGWIVALGERFSYEDYLFWTRVQCTAWTSADLVIVFYLLRIANLGRGMLGHRRHRISYVVLVATVPFIPFIWTVPTGALLFVVELIITVPHFLLIVYVIAANFRRMPQAFAMLMAQRAARTAK